MEVALDGLRALFAQRHIDGIAAGVVGVAVDLERQLRVDGQRIFQFIQSRNAVWQRLIGARRKVDVDGLVTKHRAGLGFLGIVHRLRACALHSAGIQRSLRAEDERSIDCVLVRRNGIVFEEQRIVHGGNLAKGLVGGAHIVVMLAVQSEIVDVVFQIEDR